MPRWWSRLLWWRPPFLFGEVVINLTSAPDESIRGACWRVQGLWFVLRGASLCKAGREPMPIDGDVVVHRSNVAFVQVLRWP